MKSREIVVLFLKCVNCYYKGADCSMRVGKYVLFMTQIFY